jgi:large subunit ribosomal protein L15
MPLHRRLPKRGFTSIFKKVISVVNISDLKRFESGTVVDEALLRTTGIAKGKFDQIKLLAKGDIDYPITVKVDAASQKAIEKIEAAGGKVEVTA